MEELRKNFRLKKIFASENKLKDISVVKEFKFIETLLISDNELKDLEKVLSDISKLTFLNQVDLFNNPIAEEPNYRLRVIARMRNIKILDRHSKKNLNSI